MVTDRDMNTKYCSCLLERREYKIEHSNFKRRLSIELNRAFNRRRKMRVECGKLKINSNKVLQEKWKRAEKGKKITEKVS